MIRLGLSPQWSPGSIQSIILSLRRKAGSKRNIQRTVMSQRESMAMSCWAWT